MAMKHYFVLFLILFSLLLCPISKVWADETMQENALQCTAPIPRSTEVIVEEQDIPKLVADPTGDAPVEKLVPNPTPPPETPEEKPGPDSPSDNSDNRTWTKFKYMEIIKKVADKYNLDPQVIYATIMTESEGDESAFRYEPHIKDASLCMGQILISTAKQLGFTGDPKEMYKPEVCIDLVGKYHRNMLDTHGDLSLNQLAAAYNTGSPWKRPVPGHISRFRMWYNGEG